MSMFIVKSENGEKFLMPAISLTSKDEAIYNNGFSDGKKTAEEECAGSHFLADFTGDGTTDVSFELGFDPDFFVIWTSEKMSTENIMVRYAIDMNAKGLVCGSISHSKLGGTNNNMMVEGMAIKYRGYAIDVAEAERVYIRNGNTATFSTKNTTYPFAAGVKYHIFAVKLPNADGDE